LARQVREEPAEAGAEEDHDRSSDDRPLRLSARPLHSEPPTGGSEWPIRGIRGIRTRAPRAIAIARAISARPETTAATRQGPPGAATRARTGRRATNRTARAAISRVTSIARTTTAASATGARTAKAEFQRAVTEAGDVANRYVAGFVCTRPGPWPAEAAAASEGGY